MDQSSSERDFEATTEAQEFEDQYGHLKSFDSIQEVMPKSPNIDSNSGRSDATYVLDTDFNFSYLSDSSPLRDAHPNENGRIADANFEEGILDVSEPEEYYDACTEESGDEPEQGVGVRDNGIDVSSHSHCDTCKEEPGDEKGDAECGTSCKVDYDKMTPVLQRLDYDYSYGDFVDRYIQTS